MDTESTQVSAILQSALVSQAFIHSSTAKGLIFMAAFLSGRHLLPIKNAPTRAFYTYGTGWGTWMLPSGDRSGAFSICIDYTTAAKKMQCFFIKISFFRQFSLNYRKNMQNRGPACRCVQQTGPRQGKRE